jgi:hypothetical protein
MNPSAVPIGNRHNHLMHIITCGWHDHYIQLQQEQISCINAKWKYRSVTIGWDTSYFIASEIVAVQVYLSSVQLQLGIESQVLQLEI